MRIYSNLCKLSRNYRPYLVQPQINCYRICFAEFISVRCPNQHTKSPKESQWGRYDKSKMAAKMATQIKISHILLSSADRKIILVSMYVG